MAINTLATCGSFMKVALGVRSAFLLVPLLLWLTTQPASSQELYPIPMAVQNLATIFDIPKRYEIDLSKPNPERLASYYGTLAAVSVFSEAIAQHLGRPFPTLSDFVTGFWLSCWFPPNKPPAKDREREKKILSQALYSPEFRDRLRKAVGKSAAEVARDLSDTLPPGSTAQQLADLRSRKISIEVLISKVPRLKSLPMKGDLDLPELQR